MNFNRPKVSFVAVTRNDNHGGDMTPRMNMFVNALQQQCDRHKLRAELVLVEWNPPEDRQSLEAELIWPEKSEFLDIRIVTVPREVHSTYKHGEGLPLYQMIGKNVGIRRARGEFILATNVDILFAEELISWMANNGPKRGYNYHVSRLDIDLPAPEPEGFEAQNFIQECLKNVMRRCERSGTVNLRTGEKRHIYRTEGPNSLGNRDRLHTNACGDFALAHRDHWFESNAYPELDLYSFHIDSLWSYMAHFSGVREQLLEEPLTIYHLEHTGGYTPETLKKLDQGLKKRKVPRLENAHFNAMAFRMSTERRSLRFNEDNWGLLNHNLPETTIIKAQNKAPVIVDRKKSRPKISLVVTSRNDNHGGNILERTQSFLDGWRVLADEEKLKSEIIMVEWNPPEDKPGLNEVLLWPESEYAKLRYITVPASLHAQMPNSDKIPIFQMIAKNVGARRAEGEWILMTNIDVLFNRPMIRFLKEANLDKNAFYRTARLDTGHRVIPTELSIIERIRYCEENLVRLNINNKTVDVDPEKRIAPASNIWKTKNDWTDLVIKNGLNRQLFSSACGDFTMLHSEAYDRLRGYPEIPYWSIYIDGILLHAALGQGMHQVEIGDPCRMYHIEHGRSWVVDTEYYDKDKRLNHKLHYRPWCKALVEGKAPHVNPPDWGYAHLEFEEKKPASIEIVEKNLAERLEEV